jgi:ribosome-associated translation inhibitor RaiA
MKPSDLKILEEAIGKAIKTHVNGKIDKLHEKVDRYIKEDTDWKVKAEPVIKMGENLQGTSKVMLYVAGGVLAVGGAIKIVASFFKS